MIIAGIILLAGGVILFALSRAQKGKTFQMLSVQTSKARELEETRKATEEGIGPGSYTQRVELKGIVESDSPLRAEFSGTPCVWYSIKLTREFEETKTHKESDGRESRETIRGSEILTENTRTGRFKLRDETGTVLIDPAGAKIDAEKTFDRFEQGTSAGDTLRIGNFSFTLSGAALGGGRRTIGYKYQEHSIPTGRRLYVLGEAGEAEGSLIVRKPVDKKEKFIVSLKSEEELVRKGKTAVTVLTICGAVALATGIALLALNFL